MSTLRSFLLNGQHRLALGPHPERARQDAESLLLHVLGKDKVWLLTHIDGELPESATIRCLELLERRYRGEPLQYITGQTEFYGLRFRVTPSVLIPRPETEHLIEYVLQYSHTHKHAQIIDVGTGSGAITIALARNLQESIFTAIDLSPAALEVAHINAQLNRVSDRIRLVQGDLLEPVGNERFEIIVSNPPYVPVADRASLSVEVREYEPALALFAGEDGLDVYCRLIPAAFDVLVPGGLLALEIGYGQQEAISGLLESAGFLHIEFVPDLQGIPRVASGRRPLRAAN